MAYTTISEQGAEITVSTTFNSSELVAVRAVRAASEKASDLSALVSELEDVTKTFRLEVFGYKGAFGSSGGFRASLIRMAQPDDDMVVLSFTANTLADALHKAADEAIDWLIDNNED